MALESTLIAHGLPRGRNLEVARELEAVVRAAGAVPATIAVVDGVARVGLDDAALEAMALGGGFAKAGVRDLAPVMARGGSAATTVASTSHLAALAGIRVFATGGLGGVHREARESWDESADLPTLAATGVTIVCAGVKSILDVGATLERLETLNVCVLGYGTDRFPGFYLADSGFPVPWRVDSPEEVAAVMRVAGRARARASARSSSRTRCRRTSRSIPALHDRVLAGRARGRGGRRASAAARRRRSCSTASTARPAARRSRRTSRSCGATRRSRRGSRRGGRVSARARRWQVVTAAGSSSSAT